MGMAVSEEMLSGGVISGKLGNETIKSVYLYAAWFPAMRINADPGT